jgi:precorrin-4 methylase
LKSKLHLLEQKNHQYIEIIGSTSSNRQLLKKKDESLLGQTLHTMSSGSLLLNSVLNSERNNNKNSEDNALMISQVNEEMEKMIEEMNLVI